MTKVAFSHMTLSGKIPPNDPVWTQFNASFENMDLEMIEIANLIYTGHAFTTWHKDHWRAGKNYQLGQHLALDMDTEDNRSTLPYLASDKFIKQYASIIYTTPSHTPEAPRARVLFLLDTPIQQPANYVLAVSSLLWLFGTGDRQCKDSARFFYGSTGCEVELPNKTLPLAVVKQLIADYQKTGLRVKRSHENKQYSAPADQKRVEAALSHIPAMGIDYDEWLAVLMGIHSEFGDSGLPLAESWAQGTEGEVERKWRSFNDRGNGTGKVTVGTLFKLAQNNGWNGSVATA